jgi:hypothetical protein
MFLPKIACLTVRMKGQEHTEQENNGGGQKYEGAKK